MMRLQEVAHLLHRLDPEVFGLSPGIDRHFCLGRERRDVHGDLVGVSRRVVGHHQHRCLAGAHEIARHAVHEVGLDAEEIMQVGLDGLHGQVRPPGEQFGCPVMTAPVVHVVRELRPMPDRLAEHAGH